MLAGGEELWNPVTRTRVVFVRTPAETGGRELVIDWIVPPGERLVAKAHVHPGPEGLMAERFAVLAGTAGYRVGWRRGRGTPPHAWEVPCNVSHVHPWNAGRDPLHVRQSIRPPDPDPELLGDVQAYFETLVALSQQGRAGRKGQIHGVLQNALTLYELLLPGTYLARVPWWLQRALLGALADIARRCGMSAYVPPQKGLAPTGP